MAVHLMMATFVCVGSVGYARADAPPEETSAAAEQGPPAPASGPMHWYDWLNPLNAPFIPIPVIITDPNRGTTVGVLPTWLETDPEHHIDRIIAPDLQHNEYFGWGAHARLLAYPSKDTEWSAVAGLFERVQRRVDLEYDTGRLREQPWSFTASLLYDRDGTPRFYGIGNSTPEANATNYTSEQELAQAQIGRNFSRSWQLLYTLRLRQIDVLPGTIPKLPSIQTLFPGVLGRTHELLNQVSLVYDTRNDLTIPTQGMRWIAYGGIATRSAFGDSLYSEAGVDGSGYWPIRPTTILATHLGLRYLPSVEHVAFWQLSSIGGDRTVVGGDQPLRGFGAGRFTDRNSSSLTAELRQTVYGLDLFRTHLDLELAPFIDVGRVFSRLSASPLSQLHKVYGIGFRGIARPFVVGYVDVGYGTEGAAVFTGIDYPF